MPVNPRMRASDADRDQVAALLREHLADGRLTADEFQERLSATFAAKTFGELDELMADLPALDLHQLPDRSIPPRGQDAVARQSANDVAARTAAIGVAIGLYVVSGAAFGVWWIPWWIIILVVAIHTARRQGN
jgi:uncharacterized membrane protein